MLANEAAKWKWKWEWEAGGPRARAAFPARVKCAARTPQRTTRTPPQLRTMLALLASETSTTSLPGPVVRPSQYWNIDTLCAIRPVAVVSLSTPVGGCSVHLLLYGLTGDCPFSVGRRADDDDGVSPETDFDGKREGVCECVRETDRGRSSVYLA